MNKNYPDIIHYLEIGICGLSCRLCPSYHTETKSKCGGCKSEYRMAAGCPFQTCALKKKGIEFCWDCEESITCEKWKKHREFGKQLDTFKCYQKLENNIAFINVNGIEEFEKVQKIREELLKDILHDFNEGRSKSYYCIATTLLEIDELQEAVKHANMKIKNLEINYIQGKAKILHEILDEIALKKNIL